MYNFGGTTHRTCAARPHTPAHTVHSIRVWYAFEYISLSYSAKQLCEMITTTITIVIDIIIIIHHHHRYPELPAVNEKILEQRIDLKGNDRCPNFSPDNGKANPYFAK